MKIAIPTNDQITISKHFGRSKGFFIVEIENNEIINKVYKENTNNNHSKGLHLHHSHDKEHNHNHKHILDAIEGCKTVISGGMGKRLYKDFENNNIQVFMTQENDIETAVKLFITNELDINRKELCNHH